MKHWIPLLQSLVWPFFLIGLVWWFQKALKVVLDSIADRIRRGAPLEAGPSGLKLGALPKEEIEKLPDVSPRPEVAPGDEQPSDWRIERAKEYARVDGYMLVHVYQQSKASPEEFDISLFIVRHEKGSKGLPRRHFDEIERAEFYFGESWGNRIFRVENTGDVIGIRTRAWGTFLACCRVTFKDPARKQVILFRYVDFHMLIDQPERVAR